MDKEPKGMPKLRVMNSFSKQKEELKQGKNADSKTLTWYMCGPTVYDHSHMGHARTYIGFDVIHRILTEYFGYNVFLAMNITDIDDKIIGKAIAENKDFKDISRQWETEFFKDCQELNIRPPNVITRVSEYVPEIIDFIKKIIENGYAYEANGSVYMNVIKFSKADSHTYAKLEPTNIDNEEEILKAEGALTSQEVLNEKKDKRDFALWKKTKEGEPSWDSPWGLGRPGWHIECSAMVHAIFNEYPIDIHSGGMDLKFPHHDNEICQSEAYYGCNNWINQFWHTGSLNIKGKKMSKSLKNFITIKDILREYSSKQLRMMCLINGWDSLMNYNPETSFDEAIKKEQQFDNFFKSVESIVNMKTSEIKDTVQKWEKTDLELNQFLIKQQHEVREALSDNFDLPRTVNDLFLLVKKTNTYLQQDSKQIKLPLVLEISRYVFRILKILGIYKEGDFPSISANQDQLVTELMNAMTKFRDTIKDKADSSDPKELFRVCDELRDDILPYLGIRLEDKGKGNPSIWKLEDRDTLIKQREQKIAEKKKKEDAANAKKELELKKKSTPGKDWFKTMETEKYSKFDDATGLPTHDAKDKVLSQAIINGLKKVQTKQEQKYQKWLAEQNQAPGDAQQEKKAEQQKPAPPKEEASAPAQQAPKKEKQQNKKGEKPQKAQQQKGGAKKTEKTEEQSEPQLEQTGDNFYVQKDGFASWKGKK